MKTALYPSPWDLIYFQEIAKTQNLSRAAERLGVAQPTLSLSLARLEEQVQAQLFKRKRNGLSLTPSGDKLLKQCESLLSQWNQILSEVRQTQTELKGYFKFGCHPSVAIFSLNPALADFYKKYPKIELHLVHGLSRVICEQIISGEIDFGIVVNPISHPDLVIRQLAKDEVTFWHAKSFNEDTLLYNTAMLQAQTLLKKLRSHKFSRSITSDNLEVLTSLAQAGAGVAILPTRVAQMYSKELQKLSGAPSFSDTIAFVYRADHSKAESAKAVLNYFKGLKI